MLIELSHPAMGWPLALESEDNIETIQSIWSNLVQIDPLDLDKGKAATAFLRLLLNHVKGFPSVEISPGKYRGIYFKGEAIYLIPVGEGKLVLYKVN